MPPRNSSRDTDSPIRRRRRDRSSTAADSSDAPRFDQQPRRLYPPTEILSADEIESIHQASLTVLKEIGINFLHPDARAILKKAGASVAADSERVRFDPELIHALIAHAPERFTIHARNPQHSLIIGGDHLCFASVGSPPYASDLDHGRRSGNYDDFTKFIKLSQSLDIVHLIGGYPVEPTDVHASIRHLHCLRDTAVLSDKVFHAYSLGKGRNLDGLEIARIVHGLDVESFNNHTCLLSIINASSPLRYDHPMLQGVMEMSSRNQCVVITPFTLAGAMAPVTIAGALVQQNAEALAGIAFTQAVRPGAPVIYGGFTSNVDMKSGAPAFGTPEYAKATLITGQLTRRYRLPYRSSNVNASNAVDAQAAYESMISLWAAVMSGAHFIKHAAGWLEGGLVASFEKMMIDADMLQMMASFLTPIGMSVDDLGLDAIREIEPGGHFFGTNHTQQRFRSAFYAPLISDWRNYEAWVEAGSPDSATRANHLFKEYLNNYQQPPIDAAIVDELDAFVARRLEEGGVETDF